MSRWDDPTRGADDADDGWGPRRRGDDAAREQEGTTWWDDTRDDARDHDAGDHDARDPRGPGGDVDIHETFVPPGRSGGVGERHGTSGSSSAAPSGAPDRAPDDHGRPGAPVGQHTAATGYRRTGPGGVPELWPGPVPLRPLGFGEILDTSFRLLRFNPKTFFGLTLLVSLVMVVLTALLGMLVGDNPFVVDPAAADAGTATTLGATNPATYIELIVTSVLMGLLVVPVAEAALGRKASVGESWARTKGRVGALVVYGLLANLIMVLAVVPLVLILVLGGAGSAIVGVLVLLPLTLLALLLLSPFLMLPPAAIVLEGIGPIAALRRCARLLRGGYWRVVGILLTITLVLFVVFLAVGLMFGLLTAAVLFGTGAGTTGIIASAVLMMVLTLAIRVLLIPYGVAVAVLVYLDRRFRTEALAVDLLAEAERSARP